MWGILHSRRQQTHLEPMPHSSRSFFRHLGPCTSLKNGPEPMSRTKQDSHFLIPCSQRQIVLLVWASLTRRGSPQAADCRVTSKLRYEAWSWCVHMEALERLPWLCGVRAGAGGKGRWPLVYGPTQNPPGYHFKCPRVPNLKLDFQVITKVCLTR